MADLNEIKVSVNRNNNISALIEGKNSINATVSNNTISAKIGEVESIKVLSSVENEVTTKSLSGLNDVDVLDEGVFLLYNSFTKKWESTNEIDCGTF